MKNTILILITIIFIAMISCACLFGCDTYSSNSEPVIGGYHTLGSSYHIATKGVLCDPDSTFDFTLTDDGEYEVSLHKSAWTSLSQYITVPDNYRDIPVVRIPDNGFCLDYNMGRVNIPNTIRSIGENAFSQGQVTFRGTQDEWNAISFDINWNIDGNVKEVCCTDGVINLRKIR